jgi:hypothetical protein
MRPVPWLPTALAQDAAFALVEGFGWAWVERWGVQVYQSIADEATFQIARTLNRSRADSYAARQRWWRVYAAYPQVYRDAASRVWQSSVYQATKDDAAPRETRPRELLARLRRPAHSEA